MEDEHPGRYKQAIEIKDIDEMSDTEGKEHLGMDWKGKDSWAHAKGDF